VLFLKNDYWILRDTIKTEGAHAYDLHFHFAADCNPEIEMLGGNESSARESSEMIPPAVRERAEGAPGLDVHTFGTMAGAWRHESGWVTHAYASRVAAPICIFSAEATGAQELVTFLVPRAAGAPATELRHIEAIGGVACELREVSSPPHAEKTKDVMLARRFDASEIETARFASDGETAWMRLRVGHDELNRSEALTEFVIIGGSRLAVDNVEVLRANACAGFFSVRRVSDDVSEVETDASGEWVLATLGACVVVVNGIRFAVGATEVARFIGSRLACDETPGGELIERELQETKG
jgi:hypothetical protein